MEKYFNVLMILVFVVLVISIFFSLFRTIIGPRRADRIMGINMIGSFSTLALALLAVMYKQSWLLDICLVYCLISLWLLPRFRLSERIKNEYSKACFCDCLFYLWQYYYSYFDCGCIPF